MRHYARDCVGELMKVDQGSLFQFLFPGLGRRKLTTRKGARFVRRQARLLSWLPAGYRNVDRVERAERVNQS